MSLPHVVQWRRALIRSVPFHPKTNRKGLRSSEKLAALVLSDWMSAEGVARPGVDTIAKGASLDPKTTSQALRGLVDKSWLSASGPTRGSAKTYRALIPSSGVVPEPNGRDARSSSGNASVSSGISSLSSGVTPPEVVRVEVVTPQDSGADAPAPCVECGAEAEGNIGLLPYCVECGLAEEERRRLDRLLGEA